MTAATGTLLEAADNIDYAFKHIPIIDMKDAETLEATDKDRLARHVRDACMNVGFFYVQNHGVPEEIINGAIDAAKTFFSLPLEEKSKLDTKLSKNYKGYVPLLGENNDPNNRGDLHESFDIGFEDVDPSKPTRNSSSDSVMSGSNVWPPQVPEFREALLQYYHHAIHLGKLLFPLFAMALDLPQNFFEDKTQEAAAIMRVLHYPPQTGPQDDRVLGIGAHTDFEVLNADKQWIDAPPIPGTLVINLGDQFARWTNDIFKSTVHRAINRSGTRRYSMPLFFGTDYNVKLEPIPSCVSDEKPSKYEVVTAGDYVKARLQAAYGH